MSDSPPPVASESDKPSPPPLPVRNTGNKPLGADPAMRAIMPVGRSGYAITAGYLALFSVLVIPAPFAILFGILAIRDIRRSKGSENEKHGMGRAVFGIVMGSLVLSALVVISLVAS